MSEHSSDLSDDNHVIKTGYELTKFMVEYNEKTEKDYTEGYDP